MTLKLLILLLLLTLAGIGLYHTQKPLPPGIRYRGTEVPLEDPVLLTDVTRHHADGREEKDHERMWNICRGFSGGNWKKSS